MLEYATRPWKRLNLGVLVSAVLHLSIGLLLWTGLSFEMTPAPKESIEVKLVPPPPPEPLPEPQKKSEPKPQPAPAPPPAGGPPAFAAATAKTEQKTEEKDLPPVTAPEATPAPDTAQDKPETEKPVEPEKPQEPAKPLSPDGAKVAPEEKPRTEPKEAKPAEPAKAKAKDKLSNLAPAKQLFSEDSLSTFRVRQSARKMSGRDRIKQLCTIEVLEQIRRQRPGSFPDLLVPFSQSGERISDYALNASGGAFRSRGDWFNINFKCTVDNSRSKVVSFSFAVGGSVPRSEWSGRGLLID